MFSVVVASWIGSWTCCVRCVGMVDDCVLPSSFRAPSNYQEISQANACS